MTDESAQIRRLLDPVVFELGATVFVCQVFESSLELLHVLVDHHDVAQNDAPRSVTNYSKLTLGRMLTLLRERIDVPDELDTFLFEGIEHRNRVVHRYMSDRMLELRTEHGCAAAVAELRAVRDAIRERDHAACEVIDLYLKKYGTSTEKLKRAAQFLQERELV